jgi:predicted CXXCH cytochrome family protein
MPKRIGWMLLTGALLLTFAAGCRKSKPRPQAPAARSHKAAVLRHAARFVGSAACAKCHRTEYNLWLGSHHQFAMQQATDATVRGNFNGATARDGEIKATFFKHGRNFIVRTTGRDRRVHEYRVEFTFGVYPLQQYLVPIPGGRLQALGVAWDCRPASVGGQRWFFLFPHAQPGSRLYWTGIDQTWNFMCSDCHSTNVHKNYDGSTHSYSTTYSEVDVGCEACHGPGSNHLIWASRAPGSKKFADSEVLTVRFQNGGRTPWTIDPATGNPYPKSRTRSSVEIKTCARCHSRRSQFRQHYAHGQPVGDDYRVSLLDEGVYFPDGQIEAEDYEYGSFLQSRMYQAGVRCSDCHNPHSLKLRASGNDVCLRCHSSRKYNSPSHHHHKVTSAGAQCVACHMPTRIYMMVDERHDHSIRVPRPDLSLKLGVPNACNECHRDKSARWAAATIVRWYGHTPSGYQCYAESLAAGREGAPGAAQEFANLAADREQPAIARATAISLLAAYRGPATTAAIEKAASDPDSLVRRAAATSISAIAATAAATILPRLLRDPVREVRIEAANSAELNSLADRPVVEGTALNRAVDEFIAAQELNADRPEAHVNLGMLYAAQHHPHRAIAELKLAIALQPTFAPAVVDITDLYRQLGRDDAGGKVLASALRKSPRNPELLHAMGLYLVRAKRSAEAMDYFADAARIVPDNARFGYVYAIALQDIGESDAAIRELQQVIKRHPYDRDSLAALVSFYAAQGNSTQALKYALRLHELAPADRALQKDIDRLRMTPPR